MGRIKTRFRVLILSLIILMAIFLGGVSYLTGVYAAGETALACIGNPPQQVIVCGSDGEDLVFLPADFDKVEKAMVFYPGMKVDYKAYAPLMVKLAERGYMCVLVNVPGNCALFEVHAAEKIRGEYPNIKEWYICGHSLGGVAGAMNIYQYPDDYKGIAFLASYPSVNLSEQEFSTLSIYGDMDRILNRESYAKCRNNFTPDFHEVVIEGGNHSGFGDYGLQKGDGLASISMEEQWEQTADVLAEWMK